MTNNIHELGKPFFEIESSKPYYKKLIDFVNDKYLTKICFPKKENIFAVFSQDPSLVKVIIVGQDPYPNETAIGYAFASTKFTPSLLNIAKELKRSLGIELKDSRLNNGINQGVFLINTILTVEKSNSLVHRNNGWEEFVKNAIIGLCNQNSDIVFLILGNYARDFIIQVKPNLTVQTTHPSPLGAYKGFIGSNCFVNVNKLLEESGQNQIDGNANI